MTRVRLAYPFWGFITCFLCFCVNAQNSLPVKHSGKPITTTFCEVAKNPQRFNGKVVSIIAQFDMPGIEGTSLIDINCDDVAIAPDVPHSAKGADLLRNAYLTGRIGTNDKDIEATWIGTFHWRPGEVPNRILYVREIKDLTVSKK